MPRALCTLAMTHFTRGAVCGGAHGPRPARAFAILRADRGVRPYGSATRGAMGGRPQGSPLRRGARSAVGRADVGIGPYGENLGRAKEKSKRIPKYPLAFDRSEELEVLDDVNDFGTDALLSLQGGGADMSGRLENVPVAHF